MKNISKIFALMLSLILVLSSCKFNASTEDEDMGYEYYAIDMSTDFPICDTLPESDGEPVKVILLIGQSNATGCSLTSYLERAVSAESFAEYTAGYDNVLINYCIDNQRHTSAGEFVPVDLTCGSCDGFFGPEVGMAEQLSKAYPDEKVFILKYTMSGYSLNFHWLYHRERAYIYDAFKVFVDTYMDYLISKGYNATLDAVCWMQGESDTTEYKAERYYDNLVSFVSYIREDFADYAGDGGIYFIDAGISSSPYCLPAYKEINEAKERYSLTSDKNIYFPTIEAGLTTLYEPTEEPDLGHYDAYSELLLGRMFAEKIIKIYK